jgi:hypothetical protein
MKTPSVKSVRCAIYTRVSRIGTDLALFLGRDRDAVRSPREQPQHDYFITQSVGPGGCFPVRPDSGETRERSAC